VPMSSLVVREPDRLVVLPRHTGPLTMLAAGVVGVVAGVWLIVTGGTASAVVGVLLCVFFGFSALGAASRVLRRHPVLTVTREGVDDGGSIVAAGFLPWSEVGMLDVVQAKRGGAMLVIGVRDPDAVLAKVPGPRARIGRQQAGLLGSPVVLPPTVLPVPPAEIVDDIEALRPLD
jgi:hypothetical protein